MSISERTEPLGSVQLTQMSSCSAHREGVGHDGANVAALNGFDGMPSIMSFR